MKSGVKKALPPAPSLWEAARQVEVCFLEELLFEIESRLIDILIFVRDQRSKQERAHGSMQVLAQLQGDLYVFFQGRLKHAPPGDSLVCNWMQSALKSGACPLADRLNIDTFLFERFRQVQSPQIGWAPAPRRPSFLIPCPRVDCRSELRYACRLD